MNKHFEKPYELTKEEEIRLEKNLVWIFASTRSGTTWLGSQLLSYGTYVINEPRINLHLGVHASGMPIEITEFNRSRHRDDYFFSNTFESTWKYFLRKLILNRIFAQIKDLNKKIIIKEPTAGDIGNVQIAESLPNSKIIWLLRDGRDVIDSQIDALSHGFSKGDRFQNYVKNALTPEKKLNAIKNRSTVWVKIMEEIKQAFENHSEDSKLMVRYEDLRNNPVLELQTIYEFLKIDIEKNKINELVEKFSFEKIPTKKKGKGKKFRSATPGMWKNNFNEEEKKIMNSIMGNTLVRLQYEI